MTTALAVGDSLGSNDGTVEDSYSTGDVTGTGDNVGELIRNNNEEDEEEEEEEE